MKRGRSETFQEPTSPMTAKNPSSYLHRHDVTVPVKPKGALGRFIPVLLKVTAAFFIIGSLYLISQVNYLLFQGIVEVAAIAVAAAIFMLVWNTRKVYSDSFFILLGISFLFIAGFDLIHTFAYKGMGVLPGTDADLPTQLWIAARYFQSISFFIATLLIGRSITKNGRHDAPLLFAGALLSPVFFFPVSLSCRSSRTRLLKGAG
jgi:hypothetical protein